MPTRMRRSAGNPANLWRKVAKRYVRCTKRLSVAEGRRRAETPDVATPGAYRAFGTTSSWSFEVATGSPLQRGASPHARS
jgi:hypothetical protein